MIIDEYINLEYINELFMQKIHLTTASTRNSSDVLGM